MPPSDVMSSRGAAGPLQPGAFPKLRDDEIALMFSGGVDSTATAILLAERFARVHLLTYKNGYGHYQHKRTERRVKELEARFGPRFSFSLISTKDYFDELLVQSVVADYREYASGFVWCMGCKLAMHTRSAIYCMENGLRLMSDGSNADTDEMVEQMLISLTLIRGFYSGFSIDFGTPVYQQSRQESRKLIDRSGLRMGTRLLDRHLNIQPSCIAGELYYVPYVLFNKRVRHDEATVARFIQTKQKMARALMERHFARTGVDLQALLADRAAQYAACERVAPPGSLG